MVSVCVEILNILGPSRWKCAPVVYEERWYAPLYVWLLYACAIGVKRVEFGI